MAGCPRCAAEVGEADRFCTACGYELGFAASGGQQPDGGAAPAAVAPAAPDSGAVGLVACPACGATNAASRSRCGRCRRDLTSPAGGPGPAPTPSTGAADADDAERLGPVAEPADRDIPALLVIATLLAGLAFAGVAFTILSARGVGPFAGPPEPPEADDYRVVPVQRAIASSTLPSAGTLTYGASNLLDPDPQTAWSEGAAGDGIDEWVELRLEGTHEIARLLIWNGHQGEGEFRDNSRVARVELAVGDRVFSADLLDVLGPQAIDLPEPVQADRVRITILEVHAGRRYRDTALSRIEVYALPDEPATDP